MLGEALIPLLGSGRNVHEAYINAWISQRHNRFDIAVLTGGGENLSYLCSPFNLRPFGVFLPAVTDHQSKGLCKPPFDEDERVPEDYQKPRWVIAKNNFSTACPSFKEWRNKQERARVKPHENLKKVYVGCSYCGYGSEVRLPESGKLHREGDVFYVSLRWS